MIVWFISLLFITYFVLPVYHFNHSNRSNYLPLLFLLFLIPRSFSYRPTCLYLSLPLSLSLYIYIYIYIYMYIYIYIYINFFFFYFFFITPPFFSFQVMSIFAFNSLKSLPLPSGPSQTSNLDSPFTLLIKRSALFLSS